LTLFLLSVKFNCHQKKERIVKVIFIADVPNVARAGQTREVADGYARNFLFPRKLAVLANSQAAAAVEAHLKKIVKQRALEDAEMAELAKKISGVQITLKAKVGENERLYGSITGADIAEALSKAAGFEIDKRKVELPEPIKQTGICDVTIRFTHDITAVIKVNVISEDAVEEKPAKAVKKAEKPEGKAEEKVEKAEKKEKKGKKAKAEKAVKEEKPAKGEKPEKPAKEKKAKAEKAVKEEKPVKEEKKEKKPRAKAKKTGETVEEKKES
jgi:large subunit ribosomal protein L9